MTTGSNEENQTLNQNPLIDTGSVTVNAFNILKNKEKADANITLGKDDTTTWNSPNFKVKVKAWTQIDNQTHTYFHSLSIDVNVEDFMGTAELKCPYDSNLMEYWEPIRQTVVIYGANRGDYKILFIGRVRGVKQDGYEMVIEFQNYGWKFKQLVTQSYAKDNVLNKDGYTIMRLMFEALKIDSWVISESAKNRLKEVGINSDGNLTVNGKEIEKIPDLLKRLQNSDPSKLVNKNTLNNKLREKYLHNIKNINYTLKYEKPSPVMKKISSQGSYSSGSNVYDNAYGSATGGTSGTGFAGLNLAGQASNVYQGGKCNSPDIKKICPNCPSSLWDSMKKIYLFNRGCNNDYTAPQHDIVTFAKNSPNTYKSKVAPCLATLSYTNRSDNKNAPKVIKENADRAASNSLINRYSKEAQGVAKNFVNFGQQVFKGDYKGVLQSVAKGANYFYNKVKNVKLPW